MESAAIVIFHTPTSEPVNGQCGFSLADGTGLLVAHGPGRGRPVASARAVVDGKRLDRGNAYRGGANISASSSRCPLCQEKEQESCS